MPSIDHVKQRFSDISVALGLQPLPTNVPGCLDAVKRWTDGASRDPTVPVMAAQVLLLDPETPGNPNRRVVQSVRGALGDPFLSVPGDALHLLQAMILAARPEPATSPWAAVELLGAGLEAGRGRPAWREQVAPWWGMRAAFWTPEGRSEVPRPQPTIVEVPPGEDLERREMLSALWTLAQNATQKWNYQHYGPALLTVLSWAQRRARALAAGEAQALQLVGTVESHLMGLRALPTNTQSYKSVADHLVPLLTDLVVLLTLRGSDLQGLAIGLRDLRPSQGESLLFPALSPTLLPTLTAIVHGLTHLEDRSRVKALSDALQAQVADVHRILTTFAEQVEATLQRARPPELELLWWGQARYCHTERKPFRWLLRDPAQRTRAFYAAAAEAADRAWRLPAEPSAAFLVQVLAEMELDVFERRPLSEWLRELAAQPADAPQGPLGRLVAEDAAGLPVTWARANPGAIAEEDFESRLALPPDHPLDRGQWATWILRERVLERRLREGEAA